MQRRALAYNFVHGCTNPDAADLSSCVRERLLAKIQSTQETSQLLSEVDLETLSGPCYLLLVSRVRKSNILLLL